MDGLRVMAALSLLMLRRLSKELQPDHRTKVQYWLVLSTVLIPLLQAAALFVFLSLFNIYIYNKYKEMLYVMSTTDRL